MVAVFGFFDFLGPSELIIVAVIAVLLYGERLPEVAKSFGKNFMDLKKSVQGIREEFEAAASDVTSTVNRSVQGLEGADHYEATAPKFEAPPEATEVTREEATAPKFEPPKQTPPETH